ncbi:hypothetical protein ACIPSA_34940 [Streptomyces sp. NPDC086549]
MHESARRRRRRPWTGEPWQRDIRYSYETWSNAEGWADVKPA